jgi:hypothetical protein
MQRLACATLMFALALGAVTTPALAQDAKPAAAPAYPALPADVASVDAIVAALYAEAGFFETELARSSESFGPIAHVFNTYESRHAPNDAKPFQRGINSVQLVHDGQRWWVASLLWRAEGEQSPLPERYLKSR